MIFSYKIQFLVTNIDNQLLKQAFVIYVIDVMFIYVKLKPFCYNLVLQYKTNRNFRMVSASFYSIQTKKR